MYSELSQTCWTSSGLTQLAGSTPSVLVTIPLRLPIRKVTLQSVPKWLTDFQNSRATQSPSSLYWPRWLRAAKVSGSTTSHKRKATNDDDDASLASEVWPATKPATLSVLISHLHDISIKDAVLDSGSTDNVFPEQLVGNLLTSFRKCSINKVHIGDDLLWTLLSVLVILVY